MTQQAWYEAKAPGQQQMKSRTYKPPRAKRWKLPENADPFFRNGIEWAKWEAEAPAPLEYNPPQMAVGWMPNKYCPWINWWQQRSTCCCSCACCVYSCCVRDVEYVRFDQPDEWMVKVLSTGTSPKCPKRFQGLFWLQDNIAAHEHLVTFQDADWATDKLALKSLTYNWSRGPTAFGAGLFCFVQTNGNTLRIEISPNGKWISIGGSSGNPTWMYIPDEGEQYTTPDGKTITPDPEELQRISFHNDADFKSGVSYQYRVRKVAYLDDNGQLVKTKAYDDLKQAATMPLDPSPSCCGLFWCVSKEQRAFKNLPQLPAYTVLKYAAPPPGATAGPPQSSTPSEPAAEVVGQAVAA